MTTTTAPASNVRDEIGDAIHDVLMRSPCTDLGERFVDRATDAAVEVIAARAALLVGRRADEVAQSSPSHVSDMAYRNWRGALDLYAELFGVDPADVEGVFGSVAPPQPDPTDLDTVFGGGQR